MREKTGRRHQKVRDKEERESSWKRRKRVRGRNSRELKRAR